MFTKEEFLEALEEYVQESESLYHNNVESGEAYMGDEKISERLFSMIDQLFENKK